MALSKICSCHMYVWSTYSAAIAAWVQSARVQSALMRKYLQDA